MPLRLRCEYAAVFPRSLPGSSCPPPREFPALNIRAGARRPQPISTRFELVPHQGGVTRRFLAYSSPSRSPNPNHLAVLARPGFVRAAPALPGTTRIRLPSAPPSCCDRISDVGLSPPFESLRFTAHDLRHTYASLARSAGADMKLLQVTMGHASITVTAHTYADLYDSDLDRVADAMDAPSE